MHSAKVCPIISAPPISYILFIIQNYVDIMKTIFYTTNYSYQHLTPRYSDLYFITLTFNIKNNSQLS